MRALLIAQAAFGIILGTLILLQNRGSGLGGAFGGDFGGYYTKRGLEKFLVYATIFTGAVFFILAVINVRLGLSARDV